MQHALHLTDLYKSMQWLCLHLVKSHPVFIILMQKCIRCCCDITSSFGRELQPKHCNNFVITASHTNVYFESFFGAMYVWACHKISLLYCFNFAHCLIATGVLQQWIVPHSIILGDVQRQEWLYVLQLAQLYIFINYINLIPYIM